MKTYKVKLRAMCSNGMGIYLQAHRTPTAVDSTSIVCFKSLRALEVACECVGVACYSWGGPVSDLEQELSAEQLSLLGFKFRRPFREQPSLAVASAFTLRDSSSKIQHELSGLASHFNPPYSCANGSTAEHLQFAMPYGMTARFTD